MKIIAIKVTFRYKKSFRKLPLIIQSKTIVRINLFKENFFDIRLKTHPLSGKDKGALAFWIDFKYRIKFIFLSNDEVLFLDIGTHEIYK